MRNKSVIRVGINNTSYSVRMAYTMMTADSGLVCVYHLHAETDALRAAKPGDVLHIIRWDSNGNILPSKPCKYCMEAIRTAGVRKIFYTDGYGRLVRERVTNVTILSARRR